MLVTFGPRCHPHPSLTNLEKTKPPGTSASTTDLKDFYQQYRGGCFSATFSLICIAAPLGVFIAAISLGHSMLADAQSARDLLQNGEQSPPMPILEFCSTGEEHIPLRLGVLADTVHFSAVHVALLAVCVLAYGAGTTCIRNILVTHQVLPSAKLVWLVSLGAPILFGAAVFGGVAWLLEPQVSTIAYRLFPVPRDLPDDCKTLFAVKNLKHLLDRQVLIGAWSVTFGVTALMLAASMSTFRFEITEINGIWSKGFVLRGKLHTLLTLFFIGSIILVISNIALSAALDWVAGILDLIKSATQTSNNNTPDATAKAVAAAFAASKTLRGSLANFISIISAVVLVAIFASALYGLTSEIMVAGKCHAYYDMLDKSDAAHQPDPNQQIDVAGLQTVEDWKKKHGLEMSFSDLTGSFLAVLAPLLSSTLIDLTKIPIIGGH
jgi:hypothetical protein